MKSVLLALGLSLFTFGCTKGHESVYEYQKVYLTDVISNFEIYHFQKHVSHNILYVSSDPISAEDQKKLDLECDYNGVNCHSVIFNGDNSANKLKLQTALKQFGGIGKEGTLVIGADKKAAGLLYSSYAFSLGEDMEAAKKILNKIGVAEEQQESVLGIASSFSPPQSKTN